MKMFSLQGNSGLKPKDNEMNSKPWHWPINYQVPALISTFFPTNFSLRFYLCQMFFFLSGEGIAVFRC